MSRLLSFGALAVLVCTSATVQAQVLANSQYNDVYWGGGNGDWTGVNEPGNVVTDYTVGNWIAPDGTPNLPAAKVFGRRDGIRVGQVDGGAAGVQTGTDIYINNGATVSYNPNRHLFGGDPNPNRRFGDWRIQPNSAVLGTPTLNLSNGSRFEHITTLGGDIDGMWTRWNGAELNIDNSTFHRSGDEVNGFSGGAWMFASYHGYDNSVQTVAIENGGRFENEGQVWFGVSDFEVGAGNPNGIRIVVTINDGVMDLSGGDEYGLDNDGLPLRSDLSFIYNKKPDGDANPADDELYIINFTGPGQIIVDGEHATPLDTDDGSLDGGGIRIARQTGATITIPGGDPEIQAVYVGGNVQASYEDLWDLGILRSNNLSGLTGDDFEDFFSTDNDPGDTDYTLTSLLTEPSVHNDGDYSGNGVVDAEDSILWQMTLGQDGNLDPNANLQADGNRSLHIDAADRIHWLDHFGETYSGSGTSGAVPEPASALLLILGLVPLFGRRRR